MFDSKWLFTATDRSGIMSITTRKSHPTHIYTLCGHVLSSVQEEAKYLGITFTDDLSWSSHVRSIHKRANSTLGFLRRNLHRCPAKLKETAYITLERSTLEYAAPVWDPYLARDCNLLQKIQRRSARGSQDDIHPVWPRWWSRLAFLCVVTGHVAVGPDQIGLVAADNRTRANHRFIFGALGASSSGLCSSFAARTVGDWNQLPAVVVEQERPTAFKNQLHVACRNAPPPAIGVILHEEVCQLLVKTRQDKLGAG